MRNDENRASARQENWNRDRRRGIGQTAREKAAAEKAVNETEALIRSLIIEERRRISPSVFPELEPADDETELDQESFTVSQRQSLNQSVREILQAERDAGEAHRSARRTGILSKAFRKLRRKGSANEDIEA
ncbi:MAG: hypothetical protein AAF686_00830 [Pseudomonadota bacterium]